MLMFVPQWLFKWGFSIVGIVVQTRYIIGDLMFVLRVCVPSMNCSTEWLRPSSDLWLFESHRCNAYCCRNLQNLGGGWKCFLLFGQFDSLFGVYVLLLFVTDTVNLLLSVKCNDTSYKYCPCSQLATSYMSHTEGHRSRTLLLSPSLLPLLSLSSSSSWYHYHHQEPGFAGDIGAIEIWLIDYHQHATFDPYAKTIQKVLHLKWHLKNNTISRNKQPCIIEFCK